MKRWWVWLLLVIIISAGLVIRLVTNKSQVANQESTAPACQDSAPLLTHPPINIADIGSIIPLGNFAPPGHILPTVHMYWRYHLKDNVPQETTVYSPAEMTMTTITKFDNGGSTTPFDSYRLDFQICKEVTGYYFHVVKLSEKLQAAFHEPFDRTQSSDVGTGKKDNSFQKKVDIKLSAGEVIGTAGGSKIFPDSLDVALSDSRVTIGEVANSERWPDSGRFTVCPLDYFATDTKATLYGLLGGYKGPDPTIDEPRCGDVYQDKLGTAQGTWVTSDMPATELWDVNKQLTLGHSNYNHQQAVFALGNKLKDIGLATNSIYGFTPKTSGKVNIDFDEIIPSDSTYCFEVTSVGGQTNTAPAILLQLSSATTLRFGTANTNRCGSEPWVMVKSLDYIR